MDNWKVYEDEALQILVDPINLGKLKAGETKQFKYYLYNSGVNPYEEIKLNIEHAELTVIVAPEELKEKSSGKFIIEWKATVDVKQNLKPKLKIAGFELTNI